MIHIKTVKMQQGIGALVAFFSWIAGWFYYMFTNHPKMFFLGLIALIIIGYLVYRFLIRDSVSGVLSRMPYFGKKSSKPIMVSDLANEEEERIAGLDSQLEEIYRQITIPRSVSPELKRDLGLRDVKGIIFHGPPGNGKTLLARNLAKKLGCCSFRKVSASSLQNRYFGATEEALRDLFEHEPGQFHMVVLDEIDSICPVRSSGSLDGKHYTTITNQLLDLMDGVNGRDPDVIVVGTTNNINNIDPAILRPGRFDLHIDVKNPDEVARRAIFRVYTEHLIEKNLMERYDMEDVVRRTDGVSAANIENAVRKATTEALNRHIDTKEPFLITEEDLLNSLN